MLMPLPVLPPFLFVVSLVLLAYVGSRRRRVPISTQRSIPSIEGNAVLANVAPSVAHVVLLAMALYIAENLTRMSRTNR
jgi:hypothetical protein